MPRILNYTPSWLSRPSPGFDIFAAESTKQPAQPDSRDPVAPSRTIARRGTQLFVAVGSEVRWTDLVLLKDCYEERDDRSRRRQTPSSLQSVPESLYRVSWSFNESVEKKYLRLTDSLI
jgi:nucleoporin NUP82